MHCAESKYPLVAQYISSMLLQVNNVAQGPFLWQLDQAAYIGVNCQQLQKMIEKKCKKQKEYSWGNANEKWLLLCAGVTVPSDGADLLSNDFRDDLRALKRREGVKNSVFDKIIFWDRVFRESFEIK